MLVHDENNHRRRGHLPGEPEGQWAKTEEGKAKCAMALKEHAGEPRTAALKHGAKARPGVLMACDRCCCKATCDECEEGGTCQIEARYTEERRAQIRGLDFVDGLDWAAVELLLWQETRLQRIARYLATFGELLPGAEHGLLELQPIAKEVPAILAGWERLLRALSLTPEQRRRMRDDARSGPAADILRAFRELDEREASNATNAD